MKATTGSILIDTDQMKNFQDSFLFPTVKSVTGRVSALLPLLLCLFSCVEENLSPSGIEEGIPAVSTLTFGVPAADEVSISTKAQLDDYNEITSLCLFIYNSDGSRCESVKKITEGIVDEGTYNDGIYKGRKYTATVNVTTGSKRIFAIANYISVMNFRNFTATVEDLETRALAGELSMSEVANTFIYLQELFPTNGTTPEYPTMQMIFTSDVNGDPVTFTAGTSGSVGSAQGDIHLQRVVANMIFNIRNGEKQGGRISFTPSSYQIFNLPRGTRLGTNRTLGDTGAPEASSGFYYDGAVQTLTSTSSGGAVSFDFFMPENIQRQVDITSYHERDLWDFDGATGEGAGTSNADKVWTNAPQNATYIVISGEYAEYNDLGGGQEQLEYSGNTSYVIHLGNFGDSRTGGNMGDFSVRRNWKYTYDIYVNGVNSIIAEAQAEPVDGSKPQGDQPGAEGGIINIDDITLSYSLDAHYEQVLLDYNLTDIVSAVRQQMGNRDIGSDEDGDGIPDIDEFIGNNLILHTESPFQAEAVTAMPYIEYVDAVNDFADTTSTDARDAAREVKDSVLSASDYRWVEFFPQQSGTALSAYPGLSLWKNGGADINSGSDENERLLDVYDVCVALGKTVRKLYSEGSLDYGQDYAENGITVSRVNVGDWWNPVYEYHAYFTGFVDEYYYTEYPVTANGHNAGDKVEKWSEFTNRNQRRMMISMDIEVSGDGNSTYSTAHTNISQRSIQTFYDDAHSEGLNAFGLETYNETNPMTYGYDGTDSGFSDTDGRSNTIRIINSFYRTGWDDWLDIASNGHTASVTGRRKLDNAYVRQVAAAACLSRNRDLDGDGTVDEDEIRWYLPSINEYIRIGIGANAISNEAQLYIGDKSELTSSGYPGDFINDGALYYSSTSGKKTYWAVEKGSYGSQTNHNSGRYMIRCIRLLPYDVDMDIDGIVADAIFQTKNIGTYNSPSYFLDFRNRLVTSLYRQIPNPSPYSFNQHDEDGEENKPYSAIVIAKEYLPGSWANTPEDRAEFQNIGNHQQNPCAAYSETGEPADAGWRLPNLVELSVMASNPDVLLARPSNGVVPCCTMFSNQAVKQAFYFNQSNMVTCDDTPNYAFRIRCVRDATDEELAAN